MGLHVHSLGELTAGPERAYYLYLLDYGWHEPLGEALQKNFEPMADAASRSDAVVIRGTRGTHFEDQVLSWHHINGYEAQDILPAILITTRHPATIKESHAPPPRTTPLVSDALLLIPLKKVCKTSQDVADLIEQIFRDIRAHEPLTSFRVVKEMSRGRGGALVNALVLEPNIAGIGINVKDAFRALFGKKDP
jgi:hypothetical protein